jgi:hypothetical protein
MANNHDPVWIKAIALNLDVVTCIQVEKSDNTVG